MRARGGAAHFGFVFARPCAIFSSVSSLVQFQPLLAGSGRRDCQKIRGLEGASGISLWPVRERGNALTRLKNCREGQHN